LQLSPLDDATRKPIWVYEMKEHEGVCWWALIALFSLSGCDRMGSDPLSWLTIVIAVAAALAVYLQFIKDW